MDWSKIEKNVQFHTTARLQQHDKPLLSSQHHSENGDYKHNAGSSGVLRGRSLINYNADDHAHPHHRQKNSRHSNIAGEDKRPLSNLSASFNDDFDHSFNDNGAVNQAIVCSEISEMKALLLKQTERIKALELAVDERDLALSPVSSQQELLQERIDRVEVDLQSCSKYIKNISQESSELGVQAKACSGRLTWVEDMYRSSSQEYVTKTTFSQLLTSCMDQLRDINTVVESARSSGAQSIHFVESFLAAISSMQQSSHPSFSLEYLIGLSGDRQREQISQAISDALQSAISREMEHGSTRMRSVIESVNEDIKREMTTTLQEIREQIAEHGKELGEEVFRNTEVSMKSIHDLSKQADRQRRLGESELSAVREGQQVLEIEQAEGRVALQRLEDALSKLQSITVPALQRNHKSVVDEVVRVDSEQADTAAHTAGLDKHIAKINAQLKHLTKTTAALEQSEREREKQRQKDVESALSEEKNKENASPPRSAEGTPDTCKACEQGEKRTSNLEETVLRLASAMEAVESSMDLLQAEIGAMSKDSDKRMFKVDKLQADLTIHKAGVVDMKKSLRDLQTRGCPTAMECQKQLLSTTEPLAPSTPKPCPDIFRAEDKTSPLSSGPGAVKSNKGPTNALVDAIARTKTLTAATAATTTTTTAVNTSHVSGAQDGLSDGSAAAASTSSLHSTSEEKKKRANKVPPKAPKEVSSPPADRPITGNDDSSMDQDTLISTKSCLLLAADEENDEQPNLDKGNIKSKDKAIAENAMRDKDSEDDEDDELSVASACPSPNHSPQHMEAINRLADSMDMDESLNSLSDHIKQHVTPVKVSHTPGERSKILQRLNTSGGVEQGDLMMKKYEVNEEAEEEADEDDGSSICSSSFEESSELGEGGVTTASVLSPNKKGAVTYEILSEASKRVGENEEEKEIGSRFDNLEYRKKSNNQEEEDNIGSRFDQLGNYIPPQRREGCEVSQSTVSQAPVLSGSLLGRKKNSAALGGPESHSLVTSTSLRPNALASSVPTYASVSSRSALESASAAASAAGRPSSQPGAPRPDNTAQCTFCLRRMPVEAVRGHMKECELRTELCKYGCRSKVLVIKMDKHLDICPKNPENM